LYGAAAEIATAPSAFLKFYHTRAPISTGFAPLARYDSSMRIIYLDELLLLNLVIDYFLLLAAAKLCALPFRRGRFLAAACLGGVWSAASLLPALGFLKTPLMHPVLAGAMTLIAFGGEKRLWRCLLAFLGVSALFGGAVYAAGLYRGSFSRAGPLVRLDLRVLAVSFAVCWAVVGTLFRRNAKAAERRIIPVTVEKNGKTVRLSALDDSGNGLYDPVTGLSALAAEAEAVAPLFPRELSGYLSADPTEAILRIPGMRLLPYAGVDGKNRLLPVFRPDCVHAEGAERHDLLVAVIPALGGDGYNAII